MQQISFKTFQKYTSSIKKRKEQSHSIELKYYWKTHNVLCCAKCISKIKQKGNGQHTEYDICFIEDYENEKKSKLNKNINILENLIIILEKSIIEFKNKESLKLKIQNIFNTIRNTLNDREIELLNEVDKNYNYSIINKEKIKEIEKLTKYNKNFIRKS